MAAPALLMDVVRLRCKRDVLTKTASECCALHQRADRLPAEALLAATAALPLPVLYSTCAETFCHLVIRVQCKCAAGSWPDLPVASKVPCTAVQR
jgi:hypothetical protein